MELYLHAKGFKEEADRNMMYNHLNSSLTQ